MKRLILYEIMRRAGHDGRLKRKLMIFAGLAIVTLVITGGLFIWAGVATVQYVAGLAQNVRVTQDLPTLSAEVGSRPLLNQGCLAEAKNFMSLQVWLEQPIARNLNALNSACFGDNSRPCEGENCGQTERAPQSNESPNLI